MFDCPSCGAPGKGVLLLVSVAPCDNCYLKDRTKESKNNKSRMHSYVYVTQKQIDDFADEIEIDSIFLNVSYDLEIVKETINELIINSQNEINYVWLKQDINKCEIKTAIRNHPDRYCIIKFFI